MSLYTTEKYHKLFLVNLCLFFNMLRPQCVPLAVLTLYTLSSNYTNKTISVAVVCYTINTSYTFPVLYTAEPH